MTARRLPNQLIQLGFLLAAAGLVVLVMMLDPAMSASTLFLGSIIAGAGFGLIISQQDRLFCRPAPAIHPPG